MRPPRPPRSWSRRLARPRPSTRTRRRSSAEAAAGLGPLAQVVDGAEAVRDAVLAAVADQHHMSVAERRAAARAGVDRVDRSRGLGRHARLPVRALDRPWDDVLEPAERGTARARRLREPVAVAWLDVGAAPGAAVAV